MNTVTRESTTLLSDSNQQVFEYKADTYKRQLHRHGEAGIHQR
jgi:hypothetical protein